MIPIEEEFKGKVVIVTGGNKGIGRGCSEAFCLSGATVVAGARDKQSGEKIAEQLSREGPGQCSFYSCDVSDHLQVQGLVEHTVTQHGRLDCIINNAGYLPQRNPLEDISITDFQNVLQTNVLGVFSGCKYALPYVRKTKGSIINMSSILGVTGQEGSSIYSATKGAITSFTKALAIDESKHGVRVNALLPGNISSNLGKENYDPYFTSREDATARSNLVQWIRRAGDPLEVGWTAVFLASSMASYITGAEIPVTGGFELGNGLRLHRSELMKIKASPNGELF
jgi:NAD(P)-dependent dehydrogenase (short-subunit alcohol dehydrogenase family)